MPVQSGRSPGPSRREWAFDVVVALLLVAFSAALLASFAHRSFDALPVAVALAVVHAGCVAWRRRAPLAVLGVNLASGAAFCALGPPAVALGVATPVALYTVAARVERRLSVPALAVTVAAMAAVLTLATDSDASTVAGNAIALGVAWFLGDGQRARRVYVEQLEQRTAELEAARGELARRAVAQERLRIARELHDVVAHSMATIAVQAGVGGHVLDSRPDEAKRSLAIIEDASKSALVEIRRMLGLLRSNGDTAAATAPSPGVRDLPRLAEEIRRAGVEVELRIEPPPSPLTPGLDVTIFRLVQEALTNVVRHARGRRARVSLWFRDGAARVEVVDDGAGGPAAPGEGHGILGMRERVAMHGGSFEAGPLPEGGFRVAATLPREDGSA